MKKSFKKYLMAAGTVLGMLLGAQSATAAEVKLRYAGNLPIGSFVTKGQQYFASQVKSISNGDISVSVFPAAQLFSDKDMVNAIPAGVVDIGQVTLSMWTGRVPGLLLMDLPYFFEDEAHVWRALDGKAGVILAEELEKAGVKVLYWIDGGFADIFGKKSIQTLEDFKGKMIRNFGGLTAESLTALGATSVFMGGGEVYMGLDRGTIDGAITVWPSLCDRKFYEVAKYAVSSNLSPITYGAFMSLKKWNSLSKEQQDVLSKAASAAQEWGRQEIRKATEECTDVLLKNGMEVYRVPADERQRWRDAVAPVKDVFLGKAGDRAQELWEAADAVR